MNQLKIAAVVAILATSIAVGATIPRVVAQQPSDFGFEYAKSGGIAGVNERLSLESQTDVIKFFNGGITVEKTISAESIDGIK